MKRKGKKRKKNERKEGKTEQNIFFFWYNQVKLLLFHSPWLVEFLNSTSGIKILPYVIFFIILIY